MPIKKYTPEQIVSLLRQIEVALANGERQQLVNEKLPRPNHIWVYNFATRLADVPADSSVTDELSGESTPQTAEQIETGRQLGAQIGEGVGCGYTGMGLPAEDASSENSPQVNDIVIRGYLLSIEQGSTAKRFVIGFGSGSSELKTAVERIAPTIPPAKRPP